jgi:hypothetical protein
MYNLHLPVLVHILTIGRRRLEHKLFYLGLPQVLYFRFNTNDL